MRVLITGANGQVGQFLVDKLCKRSDVELFAMDRMQLDISNRAVVRDAFERIKPQVVINAAAYTAVDKAESEIDLCFAVNEIGSLNLAQASEQHQSLLLHISTDYVFDGTKSGAYIESDIAKPTSIYGRSKHAGEEAIKTNCSWFVILRTAWVFSEHGSNFVKTMLRLAQSKPELGIVADQFGGPTYAGDIADTLIKMMDKLLVNRALTGIYHYSGYPHVSWYDFAGRIFASAMQKQVLMQSPKLRPIETKDYPTSAVRPANSRLDCEAIATRFDISPSDWQLALEKIEDYR
ncbi:dTDP-4-dehydrorhamnose reductase [Shewanella zhangzhouensis]|uniref:dTDP-4-dehydrorhamnose reductase n=1 Tax=Shewanella zhangzhouensis TaxID=2864213 RepID=UPI001C65836D|nr:dTDP-4-dehydrorhamnose reductase [Shewanella zhangzhouensis]QYK03912.1 dTDP-4-dehydrorhamnose reductase [Shewanella zhangzhouensis]